jgi:hypothetical protein
MSYFRASTDNPLGWRPNVIRLGNPYSLQHRGPDWKVVVAQRDAAMSTAEQIRTRSQRSARARINANDAHMRGSIVPVRYPGLSGLGFLPNTAQMVQGAQYIFHFTGPNTLVSALSPALSTQIAADTNFGNPVVSAESTGMRVSFVYQGQGSNVGDAGGEMQNVLKSQSIFSNGFLFSGAEGGPVMAVSGGTPVTIDNNGVLRDANGNVISANTSNPGDDQQNSSSAFNWTSFLEGMGLSVGVGTALAVGLAVLIFKR